jgi:uncharacterized membrane protein
MRKIAVISMLLVAISFIVAAYFYPLMPDVMASHWNAAGDVNGYMSKFWGLFLIPVISAVLLFVFLAIPNLDPLKKNIESFIEYYYGFVLVIIFFMLYIYGLTLFWNLGHMFDMGTAITPALGVLFYFTGVLVSKAKRNYFIGIRTPWTLSSDKVWDKTHKFGGKLFKIAGIVCILGVFFGDAAIWFVMLSIMAAAIISVAYSYIEYRKST